MNMNKLYTFIFISLSIAMAQGYNPCEDKRFLELKSKSLDEMSDREYQYFNEKNKECKEYAKSLTSSKKSSNFLKDGLGNLTLEDEFKKDFNDNKSNSSKKVKTKNRKLDKEEIMEIRKTVMMHAEEDKNKSIPLIAFAGTAITSVVLGPIVGGLGGIGLSYFLASENAKKLTPERFNHTSDMDDAEKNLYVHLYKQERGKMQSSSAVKAATGGCCSIWLLLSVAIASAVEETASAS